MAEPQIVTTLRTKRDELELERIIGSYEKVIEATRVDLSHINATLQLFERYGAPRDYPSRMSIIRVFKRGEIFALCEAALARWWNAARREGLAAIDHFAEGSS